MAANEIYELRSICGVLSSSVVVFFYFYAFFGSAVVSVFPFSVLFLFLFSLDASKSNNLQSCW